MDGVLHHLNRIGSVHRLNSECSPKRTYTFFFIWGNTPLNLKIITLYTSDNELFRIF